MLRSFNSVYSVNKTGIWYYRKEDTYCEKTRFCKIRLILIISYYILRIEPLSPLTLHLNINKLSSLLDSL
jgi:hypothetical protein